MGSQGAKLGIWSQRLCSVVFYLGDAGLLSFLLRPHPGSSAGIAADGKSCSVYTRANRWMPWHQAAIRIHFIGVSSLHATHLFLQKPSMACSQSVRPLLQKACQLAGGFKYRLYFRLISFRFPAKLGIKYKEFPCPPPAPSLPCYHNPKLQWCTCYN